jgi:hypothetical protein
MRCCGQPRGSAGRVRPVRAAGGEGGRALGSVARASRARAVECRSGPTGRCDAADSPRGSAGRVRPARAAGGEREGGGGRVGERPRARLARATGARAVECRSGPTGRCDASDSRADRRGVCARLPPRVGRGRGGRPRGGEAARSARAGHRARAHRSEMRARAASVRRAVPGRGAESGVNRRRSPGGPPWRRRTSPGRSPPACRAGFRSRRRRCTWGRPRHGIAPGPRGRSPACLFAARRRD